MVINMVDDDVLKELTHSEPFATWLAKGYVVINEPQDRVKTDAAAEKLARQDDTLAAAKSDALQDRLIKDEGMTPKQARAEARKRLSMEADKAAQAGDADAAALKKAAKL